MSGWRKIGARAHGTKVDWAIAREELLRTRYGDAEKVILVCDHLNTHTRGAFYEAFPPERARAIVRRLDFCDTPKHGSWLNLAENELSCLTRQCLAGRRIGDIERLREETGDWESAGNDEQRGVVWQLKIDDARTELKSLYPKKSSFDSAIGVMPGGGKVASVPAGPSLGHGALSHQYSRSAASFPLMPGICAGWFVS